MMSKKFLLATIFFFTFTNFILSQSADVNKIAVLPFKFSTLDPSDVSTTESILRLEISKLSSKDIVSAKKVASIPSSHDCFGIKCAVETGKAVNAGEVLALELSTLGQKIITHFMLVDVNNGSIIVEDRVTSDYVEELESVMKRIAASAATHQTIKESAIVGNIMESEKEGFKKRGGETNFGMHFGYLYPQNGYSEEDRSFTGHFNVEREMEDYAFGLKLGGRQGFFINLYAEYLLTKTDICPYIGGAFGFHNVNHDYYSHYYYDSNGNYVIDDEEKKDDGFEVTINTGLRIFRTFNFQFVANLGYSFTFNDYDDRALIFTIGVLL
ncbi:MAG: hypothetical protein ABFS12_07905 [Bacteroidota bacterium]